MGFLLPIIVALAFAAVADTPAGQIRGTAADTSGAAIPNTQVRLLDIRTQKVLDEAPADNAGVFRFRKAAPGIYFLDLLAPGFVEHVEVIRVEEDKIEDIGQRRLAIRPCEYPGVICDDFGMALPGPRRPPTPRVFALCDILAVNGKAGFPSSPAVVVGRLLRTDGGIWLRADCDEGPTLEGQLRPYAVALVNSVSSVRSASRLIGDRKHFDFAAKLRGIRVDDFAEKAPLAAVYGWLQPGNPRLAVPCTDESSCGANLSPVSAPAILVYEGPESIYLIDPAK